MTHLRSAALLLAACSRESPAQPDTAPACPVDLASFCAYEFGGECPTFDEAAAMSCDDFHFASAGEGDHEPRSGDGDEWCWAAIVLCDRVDDPNVRTRLYFDDTGDGQLLAASVRWDVGWSCVGEYVWGDSPC